MGGMKLRRRVSVLFIFMLVFQMISSSFVLPAQIKAEGSEQSIFTGISTTDEDDNKVNVEELDGGTAINVGVDWSVENIEVKAESTDSLVLPEELDIKKEQDGTLVANETEIGTFQATTDGAVEVTFNKEVEEHAEAEGRFILEAVVAHTDQEEEKTEAESKEETEKELDKEPVEDNNETDSSAIEEVEEDSAEVESTDSEKNLGTEVEEETNTEEASEAEVTEENSEDATEENTDLNKADVESAVSEEDKRIAEEKHGFNLNLGSVTDLEDKPYDEENLLDPAEEFKLKLDWSLEDEHHYVAGDIETFDLPKGIKIAEEMSGELKDDSGAVVATYIISTDRKVELTFTDFVETHSNVKGWLEIISTLDETNVEVEDGEAILDPIGEEGEIRIPIDQGNKEKTIEKKGTPNKGYNADEINWEVIINKNKASLTDAKVTDLLPEGTEYKEGSLIVTKLKVDLYGNILGDDEVIDVTDEAVVDGELTIPLGDIKDAYRVEYVTTVTDDEKTQFKNNAILLDEDLEDVSADATITINRGEAIKKKAAKGYDPKTGIIEWEIEFNYNEKDLTDVTLTDAWTPEGKMDLVEDSLVFTEVEIDENGQAKETGNVGLPDGAELVKGDDGFEVTGITTDTPYKVTYRTKVKDRVLDGFKVANTAGFGAESDGSGSGVGTYYGSKSAGSIDYAAKTIDWKIEVNHDEYPMERISIEDTLGEGLTLLGETIAITVDGQPYDKEEHGDYTVSGDNPFTITFPDDYTTDKKIEISYKTEFDADNVPDYKPTNKAAITWTPGDGGDPITKEVEAGTELNKETKDSSWKNGSYNPETKEITWTIITNYRQNSIDDLKIVDAPQGNQQIVPKSVKIHELTIDSNGNHRPGDDVTGNVDVSYNEDNTISVGIGKTTKAYKIEYKTSLADLSDIQNEYVNEAEVLNGIEKLSDLEAKVGIAKSDTYGEKSGYQEGKQVHWSVKVNLGQQKVSNLKLEDTISDNQEFLVDTFKVYHATVDGNGNATKGEEVSEDQYELTHTLGEPVFTVEWKEDVDRAFIVEYSTLFFEKHNGEVTNTYNVTGDNIIKDGTTGGDGTVTIKQLSSGGGSGEAGYLVIDKVGKKDGVEAPLAGAEFDLIDSDTGNVLKSGTTDENGQIDFGRLLFGEYELYERVVPEGYVTKDERQTIVIDKKYEKGDDKETFSYKALNYEPVFAIELSKTGEEGKALEGAEFTLFDSNDKEIAKDTTDKDGKILFENLKNAGTYYVQETKAPAGYVLDETKHQVIIGDKEQEPVKLSVDNTPRGAVRLTKLDTDTNEPLQGVEFELQKLNEETKEFEKVETDEPLITDENGNIKTSNTLEAGTYQFVEVKALDGYRTNEEPKQFEVNVNDVALQTLSMTNEKYKGSVKLIKLDAATKDLLSGAAFKLVDSEGEVVKEELVTNDQGEIVVDNLLLGNYQLMETKAPTGYELDETPIDIEITEDEQVVEKTMTNIKITNISVEKKWNNADGDTTPVTVRLLPTDQTVELNEENNWKATFKDLHVYDESGEKIDYQVEEAEIDGYKSTVTGDSADGFIVTNTELTSVSGTKTWLDDKAADRPDSITVELSGNGEKIDEIEVNAASDWKYEFGELVKYDAKGKEIVYTVDEVKLSGYETSIEGFNITNLRVGETDVKGTKTWLDDDSENRPDSITVQLLANGEKTDQTVEVNAESDWSYEFKNLDEYDDQGKKISYTVDEEAVEGYEKLIEGNDITNLRVGTTEVEVSKLWKDEDETDRPDTIKMNLLQNGTVYKEYKVAKENDWKLTITDLPKYDEVGKAYKYTVTEHDVPGYASAVDGFEITNTRADVKTIEISKNWLDDDSKDRPDSIEVELFRSVTDGDNELVDTITLTEEDVWSLEVKDLPSFDTDGKAYTYEIREKEVAGYETSVNGFELTNLRVGDTEVSGTKTWLDDDSKDRPESITVQLLANGEETDKTIEVDASSDWTYEFMNLDKYDEQGKVIAYTVDEEAVDGYEKSIEGNDITNVRVGKKEVSGEKTWVEVDDQYRPDSITVNLLANGEEEDTVEVSVATDWSYEFTGLAKYDAKGKEINYTIEEIEVPGYESEVEDYNITNTQATTKVSGTKTWKDNGKGHPDSITVQVMNGTDVVQEQEVTAEDEWAYTFTDLVKYDKEGNEIGYTINELPVPGYATEIDGFDITNTRSEKVDVEGTKTWKDDNAKDRPDMIKVNLLQNGVVKDTKKVTAEVDWSYSFDDLDKYDENGVAYVYTVKEQGVPGYESEVDGFNLTNTKSDQISVLVTKGWKDDDSKDRPKSIKVNLLQNGNLFKDVEVTSENDWKHEFKDLEAYDENGVAYEYTIEEEKVEGYETTIDGFDITNVRVGETSVEGTKTWKGDNAKDRPEMIKVNLLQDGVIVKTAEVTSETDWTYNFTDLPAFDENGVAYIYTVEEEAVDGYTSTVKGYDITNTFIPFEKDEDYKEEVTAGANQDSPNKPNKPGEPDRSDKSDKLDSPGKSDKIGEEKEGSPDNELPKTATNIFNLVLLGFGLILVGLITWFVRRRKTA